VTDRKPPRLAGDERNTLLALLQYQRESLVRKMSGIDDDAARRQFVTSGTTLLWLTKHMARAELTWIVYRFAGEDVALDDEVRADDTIAGAIDFYTATWARTDEVVKRSELDDIAERLDGDTPVDLRWVLMHLLEETARHAGHADILREMIDGQTGR